MLHVFVQVIRRSHDQFAGIRQELLEDGGHEIVDIEFDDDERAYIRGVEYSERRFLRAFYYRRIFRSLFRRLDDALEGLGQQRANVYFADEGVWAVVWALYRRKRGLTSVRGIDVQHGFALMQPTSLRRARRAANRLSELVTGFPCIGYGSLGGAGKEPFEIYLTYDDAVARFIQDRTGRIAIPAPRLIKHDLVVDFANAPAAPADGPQRVLFAMNARMRGSAVKCAVPETLDELLALAVALDGMGARLVLRLHPGMDQQVEAARFASHPIAKVAELDASASLERSIAQSTMVMSFLSSVLWEAGLLGLTPVQVLSSCCDRVELGYPRETLDLQVDLASQLAPLLARSRSADRKDWRVLQAAEWASVRHLLLS